MPPKPTRECERVGSGPEGPPPPRVLLAPWGLCPARAASAQNCSPETPSDRAEVSGRVGLSRGDARPSQPARPARPARVLGDERRLTTPALQRPSEKNFQLGKGT